MFKQKLVYCSTAFALVAAPVMLSVPLSGWAQVEEIIVTARKREENLQEIPLAVEVFGREEILRKGINTIDQVALLSASLGYESASHPEAQKLSIRGIVSTRGRQSVAILVDGIDISSESLAQNGFGGNLQSRFLDIERIELVKGPQSALYGRSAFNGALQYVSMDPAEELEGDFLVEAGEFDRYSFRGSVSGPMGDKWGYRLNAAVWDEEGFYDNSRTGDSIGGAEGWGGAVTLKWEPTDRWAFKFRGSYTDQDRQPPATILIPANEVLEAPPGSCMDQFPDADTPTNPLTVGVQQVFVCDTGQAFDAGFGGQFPELLLSAIPAPPPVFATPGPPATNSADTIIATGPYAGSTLGTYVETIANPNYDPGPDGYPGTADDPAGQTPLQPGPVTATNQPIGFYMGNMTDASYRTAMTGVIPGGDDLGPVAMDPDPRTGKDFPGSNIDEMRFSLKADYVAEKWTFSSWTGYVESDLENEQDWQQAGDWAQLCGTFVDPATGAPLAVADVDPAAACMLGYNHNIHNLTQFSQELRFASNWDGWQQVTVGVNYWDETRDFSDLGGRLVGRNFECVINSDDGSVLPFRDAAGVPILDANGDLQPICGIYSTPITGDLFQASQDDRAKIWDGILDDVLGTRETEHTSAYFLLETDLSQAFGGDAGKWTFTFEGRFNDEQTSTRGMDSSASGSTGVNICGNGPIQSGRNLGSTGTSFSVPTLTPAVVTRTGGNSCAGQVVDGWTVLGGPSLALSSTSGPPNSPWLTGSVDPVTGLYTANGYTIPPCAMVDLTGVARTPRAIVDNCGVGIDLDPAARAAFQDQCTNSLVEIAVAGQAAPGIIGSVSQMLTPDQLQAAERLPGPDGMVNTDDDVPGENLHCFNTHNVGSTDESWFTPKVSLQWAPKDNLMFYLSWARGEKPAGHGTINFGSSGFDPTKTFFEAEVMDVTELGYKTAWFENTLIVNGAFFFQDYTDKQVNTQIIVPDPVIPGNFSTSPQTINAAGAEVPGLELDATWAPAFEIVGGNMQLSLSYTYLDAEFTDYKSSGAGTDTYLSQSCIPDPTFLTDAAGGPDVPVPDCILDRSGNKLEDAPEHSAIISGHYDHPFFGGGSSTWYFEFDTTYRDKTFLEDENTAQTDSWMNTNIRLGWHNDRYEAVFFVNNVADDDTMMRAFTTPGLASSFIFARTQNIVSNPPTQTVDFNSAKSANTSFARGGPEFNSGVAVGTLRPPRHWGVRFAMKFGGG